MKQKANYKQVATLPNNHKGVLLFILEILVVVGVCVGGALLADVIGKIRIVSRGNYEFLVQCIVVYFVVAVALQCILTTIVGKGKIVWEFTVARQSPYPCNYVGKTTYVLLVNGLHVLLSVVMIALLTVVKDGDIIALLLLILACNLAAIVSDICQTIFVLKQPKGTYFKNDGKCLTASVVRDEQN